MELVTAPASAPNNTLESNQPVSLQSLWKALLEYCYDFGSETLLEDECNMTERAQKLQEIIKIIGELTMVRDLADKDKKAALEQGVRLARMLQSTISQKSGSSHVMRLEQQCQQSLIELLMLHMLPWQPSNRALQHIIEALLTQEEAENGGNKKARKSKNTLKGRVSYRLRSGGSVPLQWMLIMTSLQSHLCTQHPLLSHLEQEVPLKEKIQSRLIPQIALLVLHLTTHEKERNLFGQLLIVLGQHISNMELPVIPLMVKKVHEMIFENIRENMKAITSDFTLSALNHQTYSLQNLNSLLTLAEMCRDTAAIQMKRELIPAEGTCSYCGVKRLQAIARPIYRKIRITRGRQTAELTICNSCCKQLGTSPQDEHDQRVLMPLLLSPYLGELSPQFTLTKQALSSLLIASEEAGRQISLPKSIALNNERKFPLEFIEATYRSHLLARQEIGLIIEMSWKMVSVLISAPEPKVRLKAVKTAMSSPLFYYFYCQQLPNQRLSICRKHYIEAMANHYNDKSHEVRLACLQSGLAFCERGLASPQEQQKLIMDLFRRLNWAETTKDQMQGIVGLLGKRVIISIQKRLADVSLKVRILLGALKCVLRGWKDLMERCEMGLRLKPKEVDELCRVIHQSMKELHVISQSSVKSSEKEQVIDQINSWLAQELPLKEIQADEFDNFHEKVTMKLLMKYELSGSMLSSIPYINAPIIDQLVIISKQLRQYPQVHNAIEHNLQSLINTTFCSLYHLKQHVQPSVHGTSLAQTVSKQIKSLSSYLSSSFLLNLLSTDMSHLQIILINQMMAYGIMSGQVKAESFKLLASTHNLKSYPHQTLKASFKTEPVQSKIQAFTHTLLQSIKTLPIPLVPLYTQTAVYGMLLTNQQTKIIHQIRLYEANSSHFMDKLLECSPQDESPIVGKQWFFGISRALIILANIVLTLQKTINFWEKLRNMEEEKGKQAKRQIEVSLTQDFVNAKERVLKVLLLRWQYPKLFSYLGPDAESLHQELFSMLKQFCELHPPFLMSCQRVFQRVAQDGDALLVRDLYSLFRHVLPICSTKLLSFINNHFQSTIHSLMDHKTISISPFLHETALKLMGQLLIKGVTGTMVHHNGASILIAVFNPNRRVREVGLDIVKEVYIKEGNQRWLIKAIETAMCRYMKHYFEGAKFPWQNALIFTNDQQKAIQKLSDLISAKKTGIQVKKQIIKGQNTVIKQVILFLSNRPEALIEFPMQTVLKLRVIQAHKNLDCFEMSQALFCLDLLANFHFSIYEPQERLESQDSKQQSSSQSFEERVTIAWAYRQLLNTLAYLCQQKLYSAQKKACQSQAEGTNNFTVTLKPSTILLSDPTKSPPTPKVYSDLQDDIETLLEVLRGQIQVPNKAHLESSDTSCISWKSKIPSKGRQAKTSKVPRTKPKSHSAMPKTTKKVEIQTEKDYRGKLRLRAGPRPEYSE